MSYVKTPLYNVQGDQLLSETTFDQVKQHTGTDAKSLDVVIDEITQTVNNLNGSGSETVIQNIQEVTQNVTEVENRVETIEKDYAKSDYVDNKDTETLNSAKKFVNDKIVISNVDLQDGVSTLESGKLYVVYSD